jgi:hypothetical protein
MLWRVEIICTRVPGCFMFQRCLDTCMDFVPVGIQRALNAEEKLGGLDFRKVIIGAYLEDCATGAIHA